MISCYLNAIGMASEGIENWQSFQALARGETVFNAEPMARYAPQSLPANERRRSSQLVRLAFRGIEQIREQLGKQKYATVFASSGGDYDIFNKICSALAQQEKVVSPTQFHNSVHNAPAGYWSIATQNTAPSTTISAYDFSFAMGLLDAASQLKTEAENVLLAVYDMVPPSPIVELRPVIADFTASLLLSTQPTDTCLCQLTINTVDTAWQESSLDNPQLDALMKGNAAARSLLLFSAIARRQKQACLQLQGRHTLSIELAYPQC